MNILLVYVIQDLIFEGERRSQIIDGRSSRARRQVGDVGFMVNFVCAVGDHFPVARRTFFLDSLAGSQFSIIIIERPSRKVSCIGQISQATGMPGKRCRRCADAATSIVNYCDIWESNPKIVANEHRSRIVAE